MAYVTLESEADELYGTSLEEFTASRNARAKQVRAGGDRTLAAQIGKLPKPRLVAWVLNMLVRHVPDDVDRLVELGAQIRSAQYGGDRDELRALDDERRSLTDELTRQARSIASDLGRNVDDPLAAEVKNTLRAAMADPAGGAALRSGRLIDGFAATGFEPVDVAAVVAVPDAVSVPEEAPPPQTAPPRRHLRAVPSTDKPAKKATKKPAKRPAEKRPAEPAAKAKSEAQEALQEARDALDQATRARRRSIQTYADATSQRESLESERAALQERLRNLDRDLAQAHRAEDKAQRDKERAERAYADAERGVNRAETRAKG